jgi:hypothetical protein
VCVCVCVGVGVGVGVGVWEGGQGRQGEAGEPSAFCLAIC